MQNPPGQLSIFQRIHQFRLILHVVTVASRFTDAPAFLAFRGDASAPKSRRSRLWRARRAAANLAGRTAAVLILCRASVCHAEQRLEWRDDWRRVGPSEAVASALMFGGSAAVSWWVPAATEAAWVSPIWIDTAFRNGLRLTSQARRSRAATVSDTLLVASILQPALVDSLLVAGMVDRSRDVATQLEGINMQTYALTLLFNASAKRLFARQRPYVIGCVEDIGHSDRCESPDRFRSYYSGHSAISAASAGLVCAHHTHLPLYGSVAGDTAACIAALTGTLSTGLLRVAADRHWATDVLTGHIVGLLAGYLLPSLLYYHSFRRREAIEPAADQQATLRILPPPLLGLSGAF